MKGAIIFLFFGLFGLNVALAQDDTPSFPVFASVEEKIDSMITFSTEFMGLKYRYGNNTPTGFDCSGFTGYIYSQFGYKLGRSASDQYRQGQEISVEHIRRGDLVFFRERNRNGTYRINHVGMVVSVDAADGSFHFIHSCRRGVLIDHSTMEYYQRRFCGIRRIVESDAEFMKNEEDEKVYYQDND